jgi:ferrous iron transport protein A
MTLDQLPTGGHGRVDGVDGDAVLRRRLMELGLCGGAAVSVLRRAPLGDPLVVRVRGYELSLRAEQARLVRIQ